MNRRAFLKSAAATSLFAVPAVRAARSSGDARDDDEILGQCRSRIEQHRKADATLVLRDANGRPVPRATVKTEQVAHDFLFGCNFFMFGRVGDPEREAAYRERFTALFNFCTLGFYWANYERTRGQPNYDYTDQVVEYCAQHGLRCKGHPLVWDHRAGSPRWLPDDLDEIEQLSRVRVREIVARFKGRLDTWDVVNEAAHLPDKVNQTRMAQFGARIGAVPYTVRHMKLARAANPQATLLVNDYRTGADYRQVVEGLRESGRLLCDAIGIQSHMHGGLWPLRKAWDVCDTYAAFGAPLHFTETTLVSGPRLGPGENWGETTPEGEVKQADGAVNFYTALFAHPAVQALTWWDFSDHGAWQRAAAGWLRKDQSPKPVYERMLALIKGEWWSKAEGLSDAQGRLTRRLFHGRHRVTVTLPNGLEVEREIHVRPGQINRFELTLA